MNLKDIKKYFSKNDIEHVEEVAKIALKGTGADELSKAEYVNLKELLEVMALEDIYRRRYKNS